MGKNVIGLLPGHDPVLRNEAVIVGAHYDHLGLGGFGSLDPDSTGKVHNGADDNASGAAMLIQIAARLAAVAPGPHGALHRLQRRGAGSAGLGLLREAADLSARHHVGDDQPRHGGPAPERAGSSSTASRTAKEFPALLDSLNWHAGFDLKAQGDGYGPSDQSSFYAAGRPVLHIFTDLHEDYHRTTDDWQKINLDGFRRVTNFAVGLVTAIANRPTRLTPVDVASAATRDGHHHQRASVTAPTSAPFPDMTDNPGGVRLLGVRAGQPGGEGGAPGRRHHHPDRQAWRYPIFRP